MLQLKIQIVEEVASVDDFLKLRKISGLSERPLEAAIKPQKKKTVTSVPSACL